jgi:hypothetical protein
MPATRARPRLEVHAHSYIRGPLATWRTMNFEHAHEAGDTGHQHPDTGPASFTIDRDDWYAATGLRGGGRKTFARTPTRPQLERVELEDWQRSFKVVFCDRGLTPEITRSTGMTEESYQAMRDEFVAAAAGHVPTLPDDGSPGTGGAAVARMALGFDMEVVYEYEDLRGEVVEEPPPKPDHHNDYGAWGLV